MGPVDCFTDPNGLLCASECFSCILGGCKEHFKTLETVNPVITFIVMSLVVIAWAHDESGRADAGMQRGCHVISEGYLRTKQPLATRDSQHPLYSDI